MPELPEAETIARGLNAALAGRRVLRLRVHREEVVEPMSPAGFRRALGGRRIENVGRRAKWIAAQLDNGHRWVTQLRMTGRFTWEPPMDASASSRCPDASRRRASRPSCTAHGRQFATFCSTRIESRESGTSTPARPATLPKWIRAVRPRASIRRRSDASATPSARCSAALSIDAGQRSATTGMCWAAAANSRTC